MCAIRGCRAKVMGARRIICLRYSALVDSLDFKFLLDVAIEGEEKFIGPRLLASLCGSGQLFYGHDTVQIMEKGKAK